MGNKNEAIFALNWLADTCFPGSVDGGPSPMQGQVMQRVDGLIECQKPSGCIERPEEALKTLLKGGSPYDMSTTSDSLASYQSELVSLPADIRGCPDLESVLPHSDRQFLEEKAELMIKPPEEIEKGGLVQPYWDPRLRFNKKAYNSLVKRLHSIGYFNYTTKPMCRVGVFFVWKSSRTKLRMITDARRSNACFRDPPGVSLMTGEGLGKIEVVFEDAVWTTQEMLDSVSTFIGLSDVRDCFHRMRVPGWLSRFFAWEAVPAHVVGLTGQCIDGKELGHNDAVFPCAGSLCQGFSWSLYFAQRANEFLCQSINPLAEAKLSNDRGGPIVMRIGKNSEAKTHFYVYVDNLGVISSDKKAVEDAMDGLQVCFNSLGLQLHATEISDGYVEALGCVLDGRSMQSRVNPKRLWRIHHGIKALLGRGRCTGKTLEVIIGHCTFLGLLRRSSLSVFHSVYGFIHKNYFVVEKLWSSVVKELRCFMGVCFLLTQDWWRPWNRAVTSSDSSLSGYGVSQAWWPADVVAEAGRQSERSRFRRRESHSARESALTAAGFHFDGQRWGPFDTEGLKRLAEAGWEIDRQFQEIPAFGLKREHWWPKFWGAWKHRENIGILEARTVLKAVKRFCLTRFGHDVRHLHLCDNLGVVLSIERSRSKNYKLLKIIRCISAFLLARNVSLSIRWIPSELNFSDEPSRVFDEEESKLLIDLIQSDDFGGVSSRVPPEPRHEQQTHTSVESDTCRSSAAASATCKEEDKGVITEGGSGSAHWEISTKQEPHSGCCSFSRQKPEGEESDSHSSGLSRSHERPEREQGEAIPCRRRFRSDREYFIRMGGRERRKEKAHTAKKEKAESAEAGGLRNDSGETRPESSGSCQCDKEGERKLRFKVEGDTGFGSEVKSEHRRGEAVDSMLVSLFNEKYLEGEGSHYGDYVMAALMDRKPMFGKHGDKRLPRAWRSLKGWRKLCPSRSRLAYPLAVWCAVSWRMVCNGHLSKAIFNLIQLSTYHRPGALLKLRKLGLVKPVAGVTGYWSLVTSLTETSDVSKVGGKDDSILLDSEWLQFIEPILERMNRGRKKDFVWDFDYGEYLSVFRQACEELRIDLVPYHARHSGPSIDRAAKSRELEEVRKRGGWLTRQSVMRYEKAGRLAATWQKLDAELQMVCKAAEQHLEAIILGRPYPHISLPK